MATRQGKDESVGLRLLLTSTSAVISEASTFPIDITKTRLQLQGEGGGQGELKRKAIAMARNIVKEEGISGLYKGLSPALFRHAFYSSFRIVAYEQMRGGLRGQSGQEDISAGAKALVGGTAGMIGQVIASPADLIKVRMQSDGRLIRLGQTPRYTGLADAFSKIVKSEGVTGLWKGVGPNVQRAFLVNMGELACYDGAKQWVISRGILEDNIAAHTIASILSGLSATALSCPADVVKTRMMNQPHDIKLYNNSIDCLVKTVRVEGVKALWKGFFPTWTRLGPWQFVFWVSYEQLRKTVGLSPF